jgi:outer membrane protein assembly factor BamB
MLRAALTFTLAAIAVAASDWTRFRGPDGSGVSESTVVPVEFGPGRNLTWRVAVPPGNSSPVIAGGRLYLTAYEDRFILLLCFDASTGKEMWRRRVERVHSERRSKPNDPATPTPVTDGRNVYFLVPDFGLLSYTAGGVERWRLPLGPFNPPHGMATSPVLAAGNVVLAVDQTTGSFIAAYRTSDGSIAWKHDRPSLVGGYSTPVAYRPASGAEQVVVSSPTELIAYDAVAGTKIWSADRMGVLPISVPVIGNGTFFINNAAVPPFEDLAITFKADKNSDGRLTPEEFPDPAFQEAVRSIDRTYGNGDGAIDAKEWNGALKIMQSLNALVAVRPGAHVKAGERELWRVTKGLSDVPSPLYYRGVLYMVKNGGIVTSFSPETGDALKQTRLPDAADRYFASPVAAGGAIYFTSERGTISVLQAGPDAKVLATNNLREECYATPAIANGGLYFRTREALYFFSKPR